MRDFFLPRVLQLVYCGACAVGVDAPQFESFYKVPISTKISSEFDKMLTKIDKFLTPPQFERKSGSEQRLNNTPFDVSTEAYQFCLLSHNKTGLEQFQGLH